MTDRKLHETARDGHLKIVNGIEEHLGMERTATLRKRHREMQRQMSVIVAWAKARGYRLPE